MLLERSALIAGDVRAEILQLDPTSIVDVADSPGAAMARMAPRPAIDLLVVSDRSGRAFEEPEIHRLLRKSRAVLALSNEAEAARPPGTFMLSTEPFTSGSLRRDLLAINLDGAPLFQR